MTKSLPPLLKKYFWGDDFNQMNWEDHKTYIIQTILEKGDREAVTWLLTQIDRQELAHLVPSLKLHPRSRHFWLLYLS